MTSTDPFHQFLIQAGGNHSPDRPGAISHFGDATAEYRALSDAMALVPRTDRAIEVAGPDRKGWLNNLVTNQVANLTPGEGAYAFVLNVQGRILFDVNVLALPDWFWLDVDRQWADAAISHLQKYHIIEEVELRDARDSFVHLGLTGPLLAKWAAGIGVQNVLELPSLAHRSVNIDDIECTLVRHDFCGQPGIELIVPADRAIEVWNAILAGSESASPVAVGLDAVNVRRIEAGIPWPGSEITDDVLPAETRQLERAVSYVKGCYLGQEVVERMRSRKVVARLLVGLTINSDVPPPKGSSLLDQAGKAVGTLTSVCRSPAMDAVIALGYVRTGHQNPGTMLTLRSSNSEVAAHVVSLPFAPTGR